VAAAIGSGDAGLLPRDVRAEPQARSISAWQESIHFQPLSPEASAAAYQLLLRNIYGDPHIVPGRALFDISLLGLGDDGHIASLLPGEPVLDDRSHWVAAVAHGRPESRITLTYPAINASRHIAFLISGASKRAILREVLAGRSTVPAARLEPAGDLVFIADRAAAEGPTGV
jgi:6-phosphogluconolactonase